MLQWLRSNHELLSVLTNIGMLVIWIAYLQVFVVNFRRQTRPKIIINLGSGRGLDTHCIVSNMSSDAIYVQTMIAAVEREDDRWMLPVTELEGIEEWPSPTDLNLWSRQGPLLAGHMRDMGSLRGVIRHVISNATGDDTALDQLERLLPVRLELQVIAAYGSEELPIGARRGFEITRNEMERTVVRPLDVGTTQIRSRRERRAIVSLLEEQL
ncbi:hypothetical protein NPA31_014555 [Aurantimonas sp. MSK8Z-1]|uniref:hypothetical protein n=1 Tax=Mangrovibrevibacter kandeliae TaxID=2968473 RepID=UPI0021191610|nr:hypothetical protein [Aurantimonas sp. MSK8Z-1]MCW4116183.1 hypothetical protein [Aurantimonas sp. MSK8Z-1]